MPTLAVLSPTPRRARPFPPHATTPKLLRASSHDTPPIWPTEFAWTPPPLPHPRSPSRHHVDDAPCRFPPPPINSSFGSPAGSQVNCSFSFRSPQSSFDDALPLRAQLPGSAARRQDGASSSQPTSQHYNALHNTSNTTSTATNTPTQLPRPPFLPSQLNIDLRAIPQPVFSPAATAKLSPLPMARKRKPDADDSPVEPSPKKKRTVRAPAEALSPGDTIQVRESPVKRSPVKKTPATRRKAAPKSVAATEIETPETPGTKRRGRPKKGEVGQEEDTVTVAVATPKASPVKKTPAKATPAKATPAKTKTPSKTPAKTPARRSRAKKADAATEEPVATPDDIYDVLSSDELSRPVVPSVSTPITARRKRVSTTYKTPSTRTRTTKIPLTGADSPAAAASSPMPSKATPKTRAGSAKSTPKTALKPSKPPRTAKKGASAPPKNALNGKLGVGVPGGADTTPSKAELDILDLDAEGDADGDDDADIDVVTADGRIVPKTPAPGTAKKRQSIVLGGDTVADPFAIALPAIQVTKSTPKVGGSVKKTIPLLGPPTPEAVPAEFTSDLTVSEASVQALRTAVLGKLTGRSPIPLIGLDDEYTQVHQVLTQTVTAGEGNSLLLIGSRGSGKSTLLNQALASLAAEHAGDFHTVRLNGLLQTDDRMALREIWRQLGVEMDLDPDGAAAGAPRNFADTLASILAILSHPDELAAGDEAGPAGEAGETAEAETEGKTATAVVFILDEFDLFATHARQTLLYNLFDIAQSRKAPIAVIGLTSRVDVLDSLEKRVKSRFSHRSVHLRLPASQDAFWNVVRAGLEAPGVEQGDAATGRYFDTWNSQYLPHLAASPGFAALLRRAYYTSKTPTPVFTAALAALSSLAAASPFPAASAFPAPSASTSFAPPTSPLSLLPSLSDLQLALLISAARLDALLGAETCTFAMAYAEYLALTARTRVQATPSGGGVGRVWGKAVARGAWEGLVDVGLVVELGGSGGSAWGGGSGGGGGGGRGRGARVEVGLMEVRECVKGSTWARWCREVL